MLSSSARATGVATAEVATTKARNACVKSMMVLVGFGIVEVKRFRCLMVREGGQSLFYMMQRRLERLEETVNLGNRST